MDGWADHRDGWKMHASCCIRSTRSLRPDMPRDMARDKADLGRACARDIRRADELLRFPVLKLGHLLRGVRVISHRIASYRTSFSLSLPPSLRKKERNRAPLGASATMSVDIRIRPAAAVALGWCGSQVEPTPTGQTEGGRAARFMGFHVCIVSYCS